MDRITITKGWEGRMGNNLTPFFTAHIDGVPVAWNKRKWLAKAIAEAILAGHISAQGDVETAFSNWAFRTNQVELFNRLPGNG